MLLCGGAVLGGLYGSDMTEADLSGEYLPYEVDFRSVYKEILRDHLGAADLTKVFPEPQPKEHPGLAKD